MMKTEKREVQVVHPDSYLPRPGKMDYSMYLAVSDDELTADVPESREAALNMLMADHLDIQRSASLRYWHIGKIIHTLRERGEQNVYEDVSKITQYKHRQLQYCVLAYQKMQFSTLKEISNRLEWTQVKDILRLRSDIERKQLCEKVVVGKLEKKDITPAVEKLLEKERTPEKEEGTSKSRKEREDPVINPPAVFAALTHTVKTFQKQVQTKDAELKQIVGYMCNPKLVTQEMYDEWKAHADKLKDALEDLRMVLYEKAQFIKNECN